MFYEKKVKYLDYLVSGEKKRGAGFVKTEVRDKELRMNIKISGIYTAKPLETDIQIMGGGKTAVLRKIRLNNGAGDSGEIRLNSAQMGGNISYDELEQIVIPLSEKCEIVCMWDKSDRRKKEREDGEISEKQDQKIATQKMRIEKQGATEDKMTEVTAANKMTLDQRPTETPTVTEGSGTDERQAASEEKERIRKEDEKTEESRRTAGYEQMEKMPYEDKWRQLSAIYPHIKIASEINECITIKPADFVIFPGKYYSLVTNSFLLHGYHNYGHLVLGRVEKRGEIRYYIGVPGVFFEKERQVALMFGFESFECGKDFAEAGDFGYYLIRVDL